MSTTSQFPSQILDEECLNITPKHLTVLIGPSSVKWERVMRDLSEDLPGQYRDAIGTELSPTMIGIADMSDVNTIPVGTVSRYITQLYPGITKEFMDSPTLPKSYRWLGYICKLLRECLFIYIDYPERYLCALGQYTAGQLIWSAVANKKAVTIRTDSEIILNEIRMAIKDGQLKEDSVMLNVAHYNATRNIFEILNVTIDSQGKYSQPITLFDVVKEQREKLGDA